MTSPLHTIFDKIYYINLDRREDRLQECENEFRKHGITATRISGVDGNPNNLPMTGMKMPHQNNKPGIIGCVLSHLKVIEQAKNDNVNTCLILEDDIKFSDNFNNDFEKYMQQMPSDWEMIYFGGNHRGAKNLIKISDNIYHTRNSYTTHCQGMKSTVFNTAINSMKNVINQPVDWFYADWQKLHKTYLFVPHLAWQRESYSDIEMGKVNYEKVLKNFTIR